MEKCINIFGCLGVMGYGVYLLASDSLDANRVIGGFNILIGLIWLIAVCNDADKECMTSLGAILLFACLATVLFIVTRDKGKYDSHSVGQFVIDVVQKIVDAIILFCKERRQQNQQANQNGQRQR